MFTIKTLNAISPVGLAKLNKNLFDVSVGTDAPDGILVRSADLLNTTFNDRASWCSIPPVPTPTPWLSWSLGC